MRVGGGGDSELEHFRSLTWEHWLCLHIVNQYQWWWHWGLQEVRCQTCHNCPVPSTCFPIPLVPHLSQPLSCDYPPTIPHNLYHPFPQPPQTYVPHPHSIVQRSICHQKKKVCLSTTILSSILMKVHSIGYFATNFLNLLIFSQTSS